MEALTRFRGRFGHSISISRNRHSWGRDEVLYPYNILSKLKDMNMRRIKTVGLPTAVTLLFVLAGAAPASATVYATPCQHQTFTAPTSVTVEEINSSCDFVQARIDRYYNGVRTIYGPIHGATSTASDSAGSLINHYRNVKTSTGWMGWKVA